MRLNVKLTDQIPTDWKQQLSEMLASEQFNNLEKFLTEEEKTEQIFPPKQDIFSALKLTPFKDVKVVVLGQDPYHDDNQAHGLSFSVRPGVKIPPSLRNILKELKSDIGTRPPDNGFLVNWAKQGILMINAVLTVRAHKANSHSKKGWEQFTDAIIKAVSNKSETVIFVLWGAAAQKKKEFISLENNEIICSVHPSPLSAHRGFFGSQPFSKVNELLKQHGQEPIDWQLPSTTLL